MIKLQCSLLAIFIATIQLMVFILKAKGMNKQFTKLPHTAHTESIHTFLHNQKSSQKCDAIHHNSSSPYHLSQRQDFKTSVFCTYKFDKQHHCNS